MEGTKLFIYKEIMVHDLSEHHEWQNQHKLEMWAYL